MERALRATTVCLALLLGGCAGGHDAGQRRTLSEMDCKAAIDQRQCEIANDLAGGPPIALSDR